MEYQLAENQSIEVIGVTVLRAVIVPCISHSMKSMISFNAPNIPVRKYCYQPHFPVLEAETLVKDWSHIVSPYFEIVSTKTDQCPYFDVIYLRFFFYPELCCSIPVRCVILLWPWWEEWLKEWFFCQQNHSLKILWLSALPSFFSFDEQYVTCKKLKFNHVNEEIKIKIYQPRNLMLSPPSFTTF